MAEVIRLDEWRAMGGLVAGHELMASLGAPALAHKTHYQRLMVDCAYYDTLIAAHTLYEILLDMIAARQYMMCRSDFRSLIKKIPDTPDFLTSYSLEQIGQCLLRSHTNWATQPEFYWVLLTEWLARYESIVAYRQGCR